MPHPGDVLMVQNLSDAPLHLMWDGRPVDILPGKTGYASYEHVAHEFGAPAASDKLQLVQDPFGGKYYISTRAEERQRIQQRHGWVLDANVNPLMTQHARPNFMVYDQSGERVWTVAEDPTGEHARPVEHAAPNVGDQLLRLKQQVAILENQLKEGAVVDQPPAVPEPDRTPIVGKQAGPPLGARGNQHGEELENLDDDVPHDEG